jgi:hypothetical protein
MHLWNILDNRKSGDGPRLPFGVGVGVIQIHRGSVSSGMIRGTARIKSVVGVGVDISTRNLLTPLRRVE